MEVYFIKTVDSNDLFHYSLPQTHTFVKSVGESVKKDINTHLKSLFPLFRWVFVNLWICPPITYVCFERIKNDHSSLVEQTKSLLFTIVMLVDFGELLNIVKTMVD